MRQGRGGERVSERGASEPEREREQASKRARAIKGGCRGSSVAGAMRGSEVKRELRGMAQSDLFHREQQRALDQWQA